MVHGMRSSSLVHKNNVHSPFYADLCLFFHFPNSFLALIKHFLVTTTLTNDWLGSLVLFSKRFREKWTV